MIILDDEEQRLRLCGLIYLAYKKYLTKQEDPVVFKLNRLISLLKRATALNQPFISDSYFCCFLMYIHQCSNSSFKVIDEVKCFKNFLYYFKEFAVQQQHCPWSKAFLLESVKNRISSDDFLFQVVNIIDKNGMQLYIPIFELEMYLSDQNIERMELKEQEDDEQSIKSE